MDEIFLRVYGWFSGLYGNDMWNYVYGYDCLTMDYTNQKLSSMFGWALLGCIIATCVIYYYLINNPRFAKWWQWSLYNLILGIAESSWVYWWLNDDYEKGLIGDCLNVQSGDCLGFGIANLLLWIIFFTVTSFIIKWWSSSCKHTPFL